MTAMPPAYDVRSGGFTPIYLTWSVRLSAQVLALQGPMSDTNENMDMNQNVANDCVQQANVRSIAHAPSPAGGYAGAHAILNTRSCSVAKQRSEGV